MSGYKIYFNYYPPGYQTSHGPVGSAGHVNITFESPNGSITYGMNRDVDGTSLQGITTGTGMDGVFGIEDYGTPSYRKLFEIPASLFNQLLNDAAQRAQSPQDYEVKTIHALVMHKKYLVL